MLQSFDNRLPPLQTLQTFIAVAESGSFTVAAAELNMSQSAISRQIQQLEHFFGYPLFDRHTRKVVITERGTALLPMIQNLVLSFMMSFESARSAGSSITVRMTPTIARRWFLPRLSHLHERFPELTVNIDTAWFLRPNFALGDVDLAITYGSGVWPGMIAVPLLQEGLTPLCSPLLIQKMGRSLDLENLSEVVLLHSNACHSDWTSWLQAEGIYSFKALRNQVFDTQDFAITAAASGYGVVMGDLNFAVDEVKAGTLVKPFERVLNSGFGYYAIHPKRPNQRKGVADFVEWLQSACRDRGEAASL